jgi:hypothetical protein
MPQSASPKRSCGDRGGNEIKVKPPSGNQVKLHAHWDGLLGDTATPQEAIEVAATLPVADPNRVAITDPGQWFHESFDLAKQFAYTNEIGLDAGPFKLSADYDARRGTWQRRRLTSLARGSPRRSMTR